MTQFAQTTSYTPTTSTSRGHTVTQTEEGSLQVPPLSKAPKLKPDPSFSSREPTMGIPATRASRVGVYSARWSWPAPWPGPTCGCGIQVFGSATDSEEWQAGHQSQLVRSALEGFEWICEDVSEHTRSMESATARRENQTKPNESRRTPQRSWRAQQEEAEHNSQAG